MAVSDVIALAKTFLRDQTDSDNPKITSVEAIESDSKWKVVANVGTVGVIRRELILDNKDGKDNFVQRGLTTRASTSRSHT